jgi:hypothetical protein
MRFHTLLLIIIILNITFISCKNEKEIEYIEENIYYGDILLSQKENLWRLSKRDNFGIININGILVNEKPEGGLCFADVNGDGNTDMVWRLGSEIFVALSNRNNFQQFTSWTTWHPQADYKLGDVDGDGKSDLIGREPSTSEIQVALSTGSTFLTPQGWLSWNPLSDYNLADVDGDGKADLIGRSLLSTEISVALSTGRDFQQPTVWTSWHPQADYRLADVNGDGKADLIGRVIGSQEIQVALSSGNSFHSSVKWCESNPDIIYNLSDVNGDGKADLVRRDTLSKQIQVLLSTGNSFQDNFKWKDYEPNTTFNLGDLNGDGMYDLIEGTPEYLQVDLSDGNSFIPSKKGGTESLKIKNYLEQIKKEKLSENVETLCSFGSRGIYQNIVKAGKYIQDQFESMGYIVTREKVIYDGKYLGDNIVATKTGNLYPNSFIEITAHYDAVNTRDKSSGAIDNASGVASILEIARIMTQYSNRHTIRFVAFAAEEYNKYKTGSRVHVINLISKGDNLVSALNIDNIGSGNNLFTNLPTDEEHYMIMWFRCVASYELMQLFSSTIKTYAIPLKIYPEDIRTKCQSDELAYSSFGLVAASSLGDYKNSLAHTKFDIPARVNYNNVLWVAQANLAVGMTLDLK